MLKLKIAYIKHLVLDMKFVKMLNPMASNLFNDLYRLNLQQDVTRTSFLWLKIHLTVIDLIVIVCYCPTHIAWLITYTWDAGELLCKAMQCSWFVRASLCHFRESSRWRYFQGFLLSSDVVRRSEHRRRSLAHRLRPNANGAHRQSAVSAGASVALY